jgi:endoglucanase
MRTMMKPSLAGPLVVALALWGCGPSGIASYPGDSAGGGGGSAAGGGSAGGGGGSAAGGGGSSVGGGGGSAGAGGGSSGAGGGNAGAGGGSAGAGGGTAGAGGGSAGAGGGSAGTGGGSAGLGGGAGGGWADGWHAGVSLAGADFGESNLPGTYNVDYTYPTTAEVDYFVGKGLTVLRIPFRWERLQRTLGGELDATELGRLKGLVTYATGKGATVLIDPHNYARYQGVVVGTAGLSDADLADFWRRLSLQFKDDPRVWFGLMNEPNTMQTEVWLAAANAALQAIRATGATNLVLVPGNAWTGAFSWLDSWYGTANGTVMPGVVDPLDHFAFEVHQYLDSDSSGTNEACVSQTIGVERVTAFTGWLRQHGYRGFLGEFAGGNNATCQAAVGGLLDFLDQNREVWLGFSWWAAGPWWGSSWASLEPSSGQDKPQLGWLLPHE